MKTKKTKILYTIPNFDTAGSGKVVYDLVKNLDKNKFEPHICCFHTNGPFFKEIEKLQVPIHIFQFAVVYRPFLSLPFRVFKIVLFFRKEKFDIIHSWHWSSDFTEPLAARIARIPWIYTKKNMGWGNKSWLWKSKLASRIITINSEMGGMFFSNMIEKVNFSPIGIDTEFYKFDESFFNLNVSEKNEFNIVSIANLTPIKGVEDLLDAVIVLNNPKIKVTIVGDDSTSYGVRLKNNYKLKLNVDFVGKKKDVRTYIQMADLFVIPSKETGEGQGVAALEAMSSQCIVLGSDVTGIRDILSNHKDCLFQPSSADSLSAKINYIMNMMEEEKILLAKNMRKFVVTYYSLDK